MASQRSRKGRLPHRCKHSNWYSALHYRTPTPNIDRAASRSTNKNPGRTTQKMIAYIISKTRTHHSTSFHSKGTTRKNLGREYGHGQCGLWAARVSIQVVRLAHTRKPRTHIMFLPKMYFAHISYMSFQIQMSSGKMLHNRNFMCTQTLKN